MHTADECSRPGQRPNLGGNRAGTCRLVVAVLILPWRACLSADAAEPLRWEPGDGFRRARLEVPAEGRTGFATLSSKACGVDFMNVLSPLDAAGNNNLMNGSGVAAGDYDGDGWCDLYFCSITGTNALFRNLGGWRFEEVTSRAGVGLPGLRSTGALFADTDGDGDLDLLVGTLGNGVHCFRNEGQGRFREVTAASGLASPTGTTSLAMADVDGDGDLDLYVTNYGEISLLRGGGRAEMKMVNGRWVILGPYAKRLRFVEGRLEELGEPDMLCLNDGRGTFRPLPWGSEFFLDEEGQPKPEPWDFGLSVQIRDLTGDHAPEIYVCNDFQTVDRFWVNDGRGRFRLLPRLAMRKQSFSAMGVDFGDLDRDGAFDFFVTEMMSRRHTDRIRQVVGVGPYLTPPGQLEGRPEVARNTLFRNWGDGEYTEIAYYAGVESSDWTWQGSVLDVDLDGYEDLLVCNGILFDVQDRDVLNSIRSLGPQSAEQSRTNLWRYPPFPSPNVAWRNRHDLTFEDVSQPWGFDSTHISQGMAFADFDQDGDLDLAINTLNDPPLLLRNETAAPRLAVRLRGRPPNHQGIGALVRVTGGPVPLQMQEILAGGRYLSGDDPLRTFAAGDPGNRLTIEVHWRTGGTSVIRDAAPGWLYEIEESDAQAAAPSPAAQPSVLFEDLSARLNHNHQETFYPDYGRQPLLPRQLSQLGPGVAWFDLDGDHRDELILGAGQGGRPEVFRFTDRRFENLPGPADWKAPDDLAGLTGWTWADGRRAVLAALAHYENETNAVSSLFEISLEGTPPRVQIKPVTGASLAPSSPGPLAAADLDGDGQLELFVGGRVLPGAYPEPARSMVLSQRQGQLVLDTANTVALAGAGLVSGATWSDLDHDGFPELILACEWGPVRVYQNRQGQLREATSDLGLADSSGWWNGVVTGDFNEDGRLDIVASNWGLNGGYAASPEKPLRLYYGRIMNPKTLDLIESFHAPDVDEEVPVRGLNALGQAFPELLARFQTHRAFSAVTMTHLQAALPKPIQAVAINTLHSTLFLNRGSRFEAIPLPQDAQLAPAFHVGVADANGDGHDDLLLTQNFFGVRPEWHRLDGGRGLLLLGDGKGGFSTLPGQTSGIKVYGEQRGAAWADYDRDGRADLVISQNGTATRLFHNVGAAPGLQVSLLGPPGNPGGFGATIHLKNDQDNSSIRSVGGAAGYWSQAGSTLVFAKSPQPRSLEITWPGGRRDSYPVPPDSDQINLDWNRLRLPEPRSER